jgi:GT2 family glycosyltransferase
MLTADPQIEVIIPNWNGSAMLQHCLRSLAQQTYSHFSITVVDNGSSDNTKEVLARDFPAVKLISFDHNTGFSVAVNAGITAAKSELLLLLNNDMEVAENCLEQLIAGVLQYPEHAFFALKMLSFSQRNVLDGAGDAILRGGVGYRLGTLERDTERYQHDREVFGACAGAALYRKSFFDTAGIFDADFFAYLEDVDLNIRARRCGLRCMYLSKAVVYHIGSATSGSKINPLTIRLSTRNNFNVLIKNYPLSFFIQFGPAIFTYQFFWFLFCCKKKMLTPWGKGCYEAMRNSAVFFKKRQDILAHVKQEENLQLAEEIKRAEKEAVASIISRRTQEGKNNGFLNLYLKLFF